MNALTHFGATDIGCCRKQNEDALVLQPVGKDGCLLAAVIDGCGGHVGGNIAAWITQKTIIEIISTISSHQYSTELLKQVLIQANNHIITAQGNPCLSDMCCVVTVALFDTNKQKIYVAHVGDTRMYIFENQNNTLTKLTHDHSIVGPLEEAGELTETEAMHHLQRNIITKALGLSPLTDFDTYIELYELDIKPNESWLLCSDGLYDMLTSQEIVAVLATKTSAEQKVSTLIAQGKAAGGKDNITVIVITNEEQNNITTENSL